jgi:hypothetical protein
MTLRQRTADANRPAGDEMGVHRMGRRRARRIVSGVVLAGLTGALGLGLGHPTPASAFYAEMCNGGASQPALQRGHTPPVGPPSPSVLTFSGWAGCPGYHSGQYSIIIQKQRWDGWQNLKSWTASPDRNGRVNWGQMSYPCQQGTWTYRVVVNGWIYDYVGEGVAPTGIGPWFSPTARYAC